MRLLEDPLIFLYYYLSWKLSFETLSSNLALR